MRRFSEIFDEALEESAYEVHLYVQNDEDMEIVDGGLEQYLDRYCLWYAVYKYNGRHFKVVYAIGHHGSSHGDDIEPSFAEVYPREVAQVIWEDVTE